MVRSINFRASLLGMAASLLLGTAASTQVSNDAVRIGVLTNGNLASLSGKGSVVAATMAVEDFGGKVLDKKIEVVAPTTATRPTSPRRSLVKGSTSKAST